MDTTWRMGKRASSLSDFPDGLQYFIIEGDTVYHEGDERSRTTPGHGYPAYSESIIKCRVFTDLAEWEAVIKSMAAQKTPFKAFIATKAIITTEFHIETEIVKPKIG